MKKTNTNFIIKYVVFPYEIMVSVGQTDDEFLQSLKKYSLSEEAELIVEEFKNMPLARTILLEDGGQTIIRFKNWIDHPVTHSVVAHEMLHAVSFLMRYIKTPLNQDTDEIYAYLVQYVTDQFNQRMYGFKIDKYVREKK